MRMQFKPQLQTVRQIRRTISLQEFFTLHEDFLKDKTLEGLAPRTLNDHKRHMEYFKSYTTVNIENQSIVDRQMLKNYIYFMLHEKQFKPCTINLRLRTLKCYLAWLHNNGHLKENFAVGITLVKVPQDTIQPLNRNEIKKMLNSCDTNTYSGFRDFVIMLTILDTGIRINELCETRIEDVDTKNRLLRVRAEVSKTRIERVLPLSKQTSSLFKQLIDIANDNSCEYVFNSNNGVKINTDYIIRNFQRHGKRANVEKRCTPHVWRHTFAVEAVKKGMDVFTLQRILGHSNIQTTRQYVQMQTSDIQQKHSEAGILERFLE
ncbi:UNVERIFIED_CONTAM: integrase/recombinase XerD [Acetivibrio alkalicellulosi]